MLPSHGETLELFELGQPGPFPVLLFGDLSLGLKLFGHVAGNGEHALHLSAEAAISRGVVTWRHIGCGTTRKTTVTIKLTNSAPASGLSSYVTGRYDTLTHPVRTGDSRLAVSYFAPQGARMESVTVAGKTGTGRIGAELGHPVYTIDVELPRGTSRSIVLQLTEPAGTGAPIVLRQPLVRPLHVTLKDAVCG